MTDRVLYFPYISAPEDAWFTRVLLYWDSVGSIVPAPYVEAPASLSPYMQDLLGAELVTPVVPEQHEGSLYRPMREFIKFLDREIARGNLHPGALGELPASRGAAEAGTVFQIHSGKLGQITAEQLMDRGLARTVPGGRWFEVESRTAAQFMAYLAVALGADERMDPITDSAAHLAAFSSNRDPSAAPKELLEQLRASVLESLLPAPERPIPVDELAAFKEAHGDLLVSLRGAIEDRLVDLALVSEEWARTEKLQRFERELEQHVSEIRAKMLERRWPKIVFGTVCGLVGAAIPGLTAAIAGDVADAAFAAPALVSAMYLGIPKLRPAKDFLRSPLAYAALAQARFD